MDGSATGYAWFKRWNSNGYEGLIPEFGGGRSFKLTEEQKEELREMLKEKEWTTKEVQELIEAELEFGVVYSSWQVRRILKSFGMRYARPYQKDYRKPDNAEDTLKTLDDAEIEDDVNRIHRSENQLKELLHTSKPKLQDSTP